MQGQVRGGRWVMMCLCLLLQVGRAMAAEEYEVGGSKGWVVGVVNYSHWAANHSFFVGDFLVFKYLKEFHSVLEVTKQSYETCNITNPITESRNGTTRLRLGEARPFYFVCGVDKHCPLGQKLEVVVANPPPRSNTTDSNNKHPPHDLIQNGPPPPVPLNSSSAFPPLFCSLNYHMLMISFILAFFTV